MELNCHEVHVRQQELMVEQHESDHLGSRSQSAGSGSSPKVGWREDDEAAILSDSDATVPEDCISSLISCRESLASETTTHARQKNIKRLTLL